MLRLIYWSNTQNSRGLTVIDYKIISSRPHGLGIIALVQLAEGRKTSSSHPDLESLPLFEVRGGRLLGISVGIAFLPVGWGNDVAVVVLCLSVEVPVAIPRDARVVAHDVLPCLVASGLGR